MLPKTRLQCVSSYINEYRLPVVNIVLKISSVIVHGRVRLESSVKSNDIEIQ